MARQLICMGCDLFGVRPCPPLGLDAVRAGCIEHCLSHSIAREAGDLFRIES